MGKPEGGSMYKKLLFVAVVVLSLCIIPFANADRPNGISRSQHLWVGQDSDDPATTVGEDDAYIKGTLEVDGAVRLDGAVTITGGLTSTTTRSFALQLGAGGSDGGNDVDDASVPALSAADGIPALIWANSGETTAVGWTFRLPSDFSSGLVVYALISSGADQTASPELIALDWAIFMNKDGVAFDAAEVPQTAVENAETGLSGTNEVLTLTADATAEALFVAGDWITLEFFNASTTDQTLELKGLEVTYTATQ